MEKFEKIKRKKVIEYLLIGIGSVILSFVLIVIVMKFGSKLPDIVKIIIMILAFLIMGFGIVFVSYTDWRSSYYKCTECNNEFKITFTRNLFNSDIRGKRHLKCPKCDKVTICHKYSNVEK